MKHVLSTKLPHTINMPNLNKNVKLYYQCRELRNIQGGVEKLLTQSNS